MPAASSAEPTIGESVPVSGGAYWNISVPELQTLLSEKDFPLVNVHVPFQGDLPNTDLSIPFDQIGDHLDQLPADRNAMIVLYCRSGPMGVRAATTLAEQGYTRVYNLVGGFRAWSEAGLPMANP
jgi:rhodanese-related sulfurtransferase